MSTSAEPAPRRVSPPSAVSGPTSAAWRRWSAGLLSAAVLGMLGQVLAPAMSPAPAVSAAAPAAPVMAPVAAAADVDPESDTRAADALLADVREKTLPNGLRVLVLERPTAPLVITDIFYHVGSVHEEPGKTGIAHFLEHMMFKGTRTLGKGEIDAVTLVNGGQNNAETWEDLTHYWFAFPSDRWEAALRIEADRLANLVIDQKEVESEREVVMSEMRAQWDSAHGLLYDAAGRLMFRRHPYGVPIIGHRKDVESITAADLAAFHKRYYRPSNAVVVVVGDVKAEDAFAKVAAAFAGVPADPKPVEVPRPPAEPAQDGLRRTTVKPGAGQLYGLLQWRTVPMNHPDAAALDVIAEMLGGTTGGLIEDALDGEDINADIEALQDNREHAGLLSVALSLPADAKRRQVEQHVLDVIEMLRDDDEVPEPRQLRQAKVRILADFNFLQEDLGGIAAGLGQGAIRGDWRGWPNAYKQIAAVTMKDVKRVARKHLVDENLSIAWRPPEKDPAAPAGPVAVGDGNPRHGEHRIIAPAPLKGPPPDTAPRMPGWTPESFRLPNGLTVLSLRRKSPVLAVHAFVDAGHFRESVPGVAYATGRMLDKGTAARDSDELGDAVLGRGAMLSVHPEGISTQGRTADLATLVDVVADCLRNSNFPQDQFDWVKQDTLRQIASDADDPAQVAFRTLCRRVYGDGHPYGRDPRGTKEQIARLKVADLRAHHAKWYVPGTTVIAVVGDVDPAVVKAEVTRRFGTWAGEVPAFPAVADPPEPATGGREVIRQAREQVQVMVGHLGIKRDAADYAAVLVLDHVLGTGPGMTHRLSRSLRDEKGLAYSVEGDFCSSADRWPGMFSAYMAVKPALAKEAEAGLLAEIRRAAGGDMTPDEVARAKAYLLGGWVFDYQTAEGIANKLLDMHRHGLGLDHPTKAVDLIRAVTVEDVRAAARKRLKPDALQVVLLGPVDDGKPGK